MTQILAEAKQKIASEDKETRKEGELLLFRAFKGLPKYGPLIKFLSEEGMKNALLKTEAYYLQDNSREMPKVTDPLFFVIDEKNRSVELTDKGFDVLTDRNQDPQFFVLPDIAAKSPSSSRHTPSSRKTTNMSSTMAKSRLSTSRPAVSWRDDVTATASTRPSRQRRV